jgi:hypothetical protein
MGAPTAAGLHVSVAIVKISEKKVPMVLGFFGDLQ